MSQTGTYKYDKKLRKLVKVSDSIPNAQVFDCYCPPGGYVSRNLGHRPVKVESRTHKRELLKKAGLREMNGGESA